MKKLMLISLAALIALTVSCKKDEPEWSLPGYELSLEDAVNISDNETLLKVHITLPDNPDPRMYYGIWLSTEPVPDLSKGDILGHHQGLDASQTIEAHAKYLDRFKVYYYAAYYEDYYLGKTHFSEVKKFTATAADLGLSVKWSMLPFGQTNKYATSLGFYAYGETSSNFPFAADNYHYSGDEMILPLASDVVRQRLGAPWRMPTRAEVEELLQNCTCEMVNETTYDNANNRGLKCTGKAEPYHSIFLGAGGYYEGNDKKDSMKKGFYWTSTRTANSDWAYYLQFGEGLSKPIVGTSSPYLGYNVFAVCDENN
ncbi:MAG: hypothetical protein IK045_04375 [Bacteroidales bacterium]|nr:hypothetical protein [Bacteroidales bacterium]